MATMAQENGAQRRYHRPFDRLSPAEKAWVTMDLKRSKEFEQAAEEAVEEAVHATFGLERDLQLALRSNIEQLELGLKIIDGGKEKRVDAGLIDITAEDTAGSPVVIELKAGTANREAVGQILGYMGNLQLDSERPVRGIIVAQDFDSAAIAASGVLPNLQLKKYSFHFSFESVRQGKS